MEEDTYLRSEGQKITNFKAAVNAASSRVRLGTRIRMQRQTWARVGASGAFVTP